MAAARPRPPEARRWRRRPRTCRTPPAARPAAAARRGASAATSPRAPARGTPRELGSSGCGPQHHLAAWPCALQRAQRLGHVAVAHPGVPAHREDGGALDEHERGAPGSRARRADRAAGPAGCRSRWPPGRGARAPPGRRAPPTPQCGRPPPCRGRWARARSRAEPVTTAPPPHGEAVSSTRTLERLSKGTTARTDAPGRQRPGVAVDQRERRRSAPPQELQRALVAQLGRRLVGRRHLAGGGQRAAHRGAPSGAGERRRERLSSRRATGPGPALHGAAPGTRPGRRPGGGGRLGQRGGHRPRGGSVHDEHVATHALRDPHSGGDQRPLRAGQRGQARRAPPGHSPSAELTSQPSGASAATSAATVRGSCPWASSRSAPMPLHRRADGGQQPLDRHERVAVSSTSQIQPRSAPSSGQRIACARHPVARRRPGTLLDRHAPGMSSQSSSSTPSGTDAVRAAGQADQQVAPRVELGRGLVGPGPQVQPARSRQGVGRGHQLGQRGVGARWRATTARRRSRSSGVSSVSRTSGRGGSSVTARWGKRSGRERTNGVTCSRS